MVESKPKTKFHLCAFVSPLGFYAFIFSEYTNYTYNIFNENTYHECRLLMEPIIDVCVCVFPHAFNWQKEPTAKKVNIQSKCKSKSKSKCLKRERSKKMKRFECEWEWFSKWNQFFLFKLRFGIFVRYQRRIHAFQFKAVAIFIELERLLMSNKTKANIYEVPLNANKFICFSWLQFFLNHFRAPFSKFCKEINLNLKSPWTINSFHFQIKTHKNDWNLIELLATTTKIIRLYSIMIYFFCRGCALT